MTSTRYLIQIFLTVFFAGLFSAQGQPNKKGNISVENAGTAPAEPIFVVVDVKCGGHVIWKSGDGLKYDLVVLGAPSNSPSECKLFTVNHGERRELPRRDTTLKHTDFVKIECIGNDETKKCRFVIKEVVRAGYKGPHRPNGKIDLDARHRLEISPITRNCGSAMDSVPLTRGTDVTISVESDCEASVLTTREDGTEPKIPLKNGEVITVHPVGKNIKVGCGEPGTSGGTCRFRIMAIQSKK